MFVSTNTPEDCPAQRLYKRVSAKDTNVQGNGVGSKITVDLHDLIVFEERLGIEDTQENRDCIVYEVNGVLGTEAPVIVNNILCYTPSAADLIQGMVWIDYSANYKGDVTLGNIAIVVPQ